jgi:hypothetical protein
MRNPTEVYVLLDPSSTGTVFGVVTDEVIADEWMTFDPNYTVVGPIDLNDLTLFNEAREAVTETDYDG